MSLRTCNKLLEPLRDAALNAAFAQWAAIGSWAETAHRAAAIVDPEGLLLASLAFADHERRMVRVARLWLGWGAPLMSVGRLGAMLADYSEPVRARLEPLAAEVARGDPRWKRVAGEHQAEKVRRVSEQPGPSVREPAALLLRLRLALGVGIKADALAFLLGSAPGRATVRQIAGATSYHERAVRRAIEDLAAAGFVETHATSPVSFAVVPERFAGLLDINPETWPQWRHWHELYAFAFRLQEWADAADAGLSPYGAASRLRDTFEDSQALVARAFLREKPDWTDAPEAWIAPGATWATQLAARYQAAL